MKSISEIKSFQSCQRFPSLNELCVKELYTYISFLKVICQHEELLGEYNLIIIDVERKKSLLSPGFLSFFTSLGL